MFAGVLQGFLVSAIRQSSRRKHWTYDLVPKHVELLRNVLARLASVLNTADQPEASVLSSESK